MNSILGPSIRTLGLSVLSVFALQTNAAQAQSTSAGREIQVPEATRINASNFVSTDSEFAGAVISRFTPIYAPRTQNVYYYEAKAIDARSGENRGFLIVTLGGRVIEFSAQGPSFSDIFLDRKIDNPKMVRFGGHYMIAEGTRGEILSEIGDFPTMLIDVNGGLLRTPPVTDSRPSVDASGNPVAPVNTRTIRKYSSQREAYDDYVLNYDIYFAASHPPTELPLWKDGAGPDPDGGKPATYGGADVNWYAVGHDKTTYFGQLSPADPANTGTNLFGFPYWSGCGPTAFLNLFVWHTLNWFPAKDEFVFGAVPPVPPQEALPAAAKALYLNELRDQLGTFNTPFTTAGATFPWDMDQGYDYAKKRFYKSYDRNYGYALPHSSDAPVVAARAIRDFAKPAIVGYWADIHYDVAYILKQHVDSYFWIDAPTSAQQVCIATADANHTSRAACGKLGTWVIGDDMFYGSFAFDFRDELLGENSNFESGSAFWLSKLTGDGAYSSVLKDTKAGKGLGFAKLTSSTGNDQTLWRSAAVPVNGVSKYSVTALVSAPNGAQGQLRVREFSLLDTTGLSVPAGKVLASVGFFALPGWTEVSLSVPSGFAGNKVTVEFVNQAHPGQPSELRLDRARLRPVWADQTPPPAPCFAKNDLGCL
jgi:hypothetical protein